ncbi:hypothetical protein B0H99_10757 [Planomicrobium soli]|uniref:Uncharacterized protein n=1 Tax=Planomicrobium soli TaxID=1176648 RepID=A0A2P8GQI6_9BACL|nr:hypothetical protein [Planomicrobium soli]PSL36236.1 hypothetical protein B0H99_10757 [Planomicrobium soli]
MHSSLENCEIIWFGDTWPHEITDNKQEEAALTVLSLMMFEQELNYGNEDFQQFTHFSPVNRRRPRDMLMGFVRMSFNTNIDDYPYWDKNSKRNPRCYPDFNGSYNNLEEEEYKKYFDYYTHDIEDVLPLLCSEKSKKKLLNDAATSPINKNFQQKLR